MTTARTITVTFLVTFLLVISLGLIAQARADTCYEDQPCWNPVTMGNGQGFIDPVEMILGIPPVPVTVAPSLEELMLP